MLSHILIINRRKIKLIQLNKSLIFAEGGERVCYDHPEDNNKIIKIEKENSLNSQNKLEEVYYRFLESKKISFDHLANCYGYIETNYGKGLVFEKIVDYNGESSHDFRYYLRNNMLGEKIEKELLKDLENYLYENRILFIDVSTVNLCCQEVEPGIYKLVIFDGLGGRRYGMKFLLYMFSKKLTLYKIKKQWKLFYSNYQRDKRIAMEK